jgi:hypothetical protein
MWHGSDGYCMPQKLFAGTLQRDSVRKSQI